MICKSMAKWYIYLCPLVFVFSFFPFPLFWLNGVEAEHPHKNGSYKKQIWENKRIPITKMLERETSVGNRGWNRSGGVKSWEGGTRSDEGKKEGEENFKDERVRVTTLSGMLLSA